MSVAGFLDDVYGAGVFGMLTGQVVDVFMEGKPLDIETLDFIHLNKTAAMIRGALESGAICGGALVALIFTVVLLIKKFKR